MAKFSSYADNSVENIFKFANPWKTDGFWDMEKLRDEVPCLVEQEEIWNEIGPSWTEAQEAEADDTIYSTAANEEYFTTTKLREEQIASKNALKQPVRESLNLKPAEK